LEAIKTSGEFGGAFISFSPNGSLIAAAIGGAADGRFAAFQNGYGNDWTIHRLFGSTGQTVAYARAQLPRCLTTKERAGYFLDPEPPMWCIESEKWPYNTLDWREWYEAKGANQNPPLVGSPEWESWLDARHSK
jgi:hypothetical protein